MIRWYSSSRSRAHIVPTKLLLLNCYLLKVGIFLITFIIRRSTGLVFFCKVSFRIKCVFPGTLFRALRLPAGHHISRLVSFIMVNFPLALQRALLRQAPLKQVLFSFHLSKKRWAYAGAGKARGGELSQLYLKFTNFPRRIRSSSFGCLCAFFYLLFYVRIGWSALKLTIFVGARRSSKVWICFSPVFFFGTNK